MTGHYEGDGCEWEFGSGVHNLGAEAPLSAHDRKRLADFREALRRTPATPTEVEPGPSDWIRATATATRLDPEATVTAAEQHIAQARRRAPVKAEDLLHQIRNIINEYRSGKLWSSQGMERIGELLDADA